MKIKIISILLLAASSTQAQQSFFDDLDKIQSKNLSLQSEREKLGAASDSKLSKNLFWTPSLSVSAQKDQTSVHVNDVGTSFSDSDSWKASGSLNLFKGGADWKIKKSADHLLQAQAYKVEDEILKVESNAAAIIFQQLYLNDIIEATKNLVKLREDSHKVVVAKYHQGKSPLQEVVKSEIDQSQQLTRLRNLEIDALENQAKWKTLWVDGIKTKQWPFKVSQNITRPAKAHSPEVNQLENLTLSSENLWDSTKAGHLPRLDLVAEYSENPLKERTTQQWYAGVTLTIPIWNQYDTTAQISSAYANYIATKNQYEDVKRFELARREILNKKIELSRQNLMDAKANHEKSEKLYRDMVKNYRLGRMSTNELLIEQNRLIESQLNISQTQLEFHKTLVEGCAVAGLTLKSCLL